MAELITECRRDSKGKYLVVEVEAGWKGYKEDMLINNNITGLMPASIQALDNQHQVWYETTNKLPLKELFSRKSPGIEEIGGLLKQMEETGRRVEEYLLESDDLVLDIDYIYSTGEGDYSFLYLPGYQKNTGEQLQLLLEGLMEYMDYGNRQAVSLVYLLHARSKQKDGGIFAIRRLCEELLCAETEEETEESREEGQEEGKRVEYISDSDYLAGQGNVQESRLKEKRTAFARKNWKERLGEKIKGLWGKVAAPIEEEDALSCLGLQETQDTVFLAGKPQDTVFLEGKPGDTVLLEKNPQDTVLLTEDFQDTMPLTKGRQPALPFLENKQIYFLQPLADEGEKITIYSFPFQIGKEKTGSYVFRDPVISRCHAKIQQEQEDFYLMDLASLNGTYLNGERLRPNERRKIVPGDILGFADIFYIFTCSKAIDVI